MPRVPIHGSSAGAAPSIMARAKPACSSDRLGGAGMQMLRGDARLVLEDLEGRQLLIPFDQGRLRADPFDRVCIQPPYRGIDAMVVGVDQEWSAQAFLATEAGQMDLADRGGIDAVDVMHGVDAVVDAVDVDVVDVEQQAAAAAPRQFAEEFPLGHRRMEVMDVTGDVLQQYLTLQGVLQLVDMLDHQRQCLL